MRCKKCGKKLKENEKFCIVCGYYNDPDDKSSSDNGDYSNNSFADSNFQGDLLEKDNHESDNDIEIQAFSTDTSAPINSKNENKKNNFFDFQYDRFLEAYIGEDYKVVARKKINIYALLLSWMYFLYRKLYIIGTIGLVITGIFIKFFPQYIIYYSIVVMILSGLLFNPIYIMVAKKRVSKIKKTEEYSDDFTIEQVCEKKGGVNFIIPLIIYLIFLVIMFFVMYNVIFPKKESEFFKENSENEASCISLVKSIYNSRETLKISGTIKEGVCNIVAGTSKDYNVYIKVTSDSSTYYQFYKTEDDYLVLKGSTKNIAELEEKVTNKTITAEEETFLNNSKNIVTKYKSIVNTSATEDTLIDDNKDTTQKLNYVVSEEEFKR